MENKPAIVSTGEERESAATIETDLGLLLCARGKQFSSDAARAEVITASSDNPSTPKSDRDKITKKR